MALRRVIPVALVLLAIGGAAYLFWFRDSSFVRVDDVEVAGVTSERDAIVARLTELGERMTTLNVDEDALERAAREFPTVAAIEIDPNFPHGLRLEISERRPAMVVVAEGEKVAIAADGTVLTGVPVPDESLPELALGADDLAGGHLAGDALEQALAVGAAPDPLRPLIEEVELTKDYGVVLTLRGGIPIRFGDDTAAGAKWRAVAAVLADPKLAALTYLDVRVPERPAVGGHPT